ncbi:mitofilin family membrane protein [Roseomonas sp. WA12]
MSDTPKTPPNGPRSKGRPAPSGAMGGSAPSGGTAARTGAAGQGPRDATTAASAPVLSAAELNHAGAGETTAMGEASSAMTPGNSPTAASSASSSASGSASVPPPGPSAAEAERQGRGSEGQAPPPPAGLSAAGRRFEPAILPIAAASVVLVGAVAFLLSSPRQTPEAPAVAQQAEASRMASIDSRIAALEARPSAAGLAERAAAAERRLDAADTTVRELAARPMVDPEARAGLATVTGALDQARTAAAESLRRQDERAAALEARLAEEGRRGEARIAQAEATLANRLAAAEQSLAGRVTAAEQAFAPRLAALDAALNQRVEAAGQAMNQRLDAAGRGLDERLSRAEAAMSERVARQEAQLDERVQGFERRLAQAEAAERRLSVLAARGTIQTALESGRPLGQALAALGGNPPVALARYREAAPPTEAALRLSFEDAARAARAAAEPQGQSVGDSALARLQGLVTVRRGEQVVVGDAVSGELERVRRSLDAGDLPGAVERLEKLPEPSRNAMAGWIGQARDLVEARAALRDLGAPAAGSN